MGADLCRVDPQCVWRAPGPAGSCLDGHRSAAGGTHSERRRPGAIQRQHLQERTRHQLAVHDARTATDDVQSLSLLMFLPLTDSSCDVRDVVITSNKHSCKKLSLLYELVISPSDAVL